MVKLVDARDLKFLDRNIISVQIRLPTPYCGIVQRLGLSSYTRVILGSNPSSTTNRLIYCPLTIFDFVGVSSKGRTYDFDSYNVSSILAAPANIEMAEWFKAIVY